MTRTHCTGRTYHGESSCNYCAPVIPFSYALRLQTNAVLVTSPSQGLGGYKLVGGPAVHAALRHAVHAALRLLCHAALRRAVPHFAV